MTGHEELAMNVLHDCAYYSYSGGDPVEIQRDIGLLAAAFAEVERDALERALVEVDHLDFADNCHLTGDGNRVWEACSAAIRALKEEANA